MHIKYKPTIIYLILFILLLTSHSTYSSELTNSNLVGSWELYKDDDTPNKTPPYEIMNFWNNGRFCITRDFPYKGSYEINLSSLKLLVELTDRTITVSREFKFSNNELKFKNKKTGWVYYKRIGRKPMEECFKK